MLCEDIMKRGVQCVSPGDTIVTAAQRMREKDVGFLPVCDEGGAPVGVITDRDIVVRAIALGPLVGAKVEEVMSNEVVSCSPKDDLRQAEQLMADRQKSRICCVEGGRVVGIISLSDIVEHERSRRATTATMKRVSSRENRPS